MTQDDLAQHTIQYQRIINKALRDSLYPALTLSYNEVRSILLNAESLSSVSKVASINREIAKVIQSNTSGAWESITGQLEDIAVYESEYAQQLLAVALSAKVAKPAASRINDYVAKSLMSLQSGDASRVGLWGEFIADNVTKNSEIVTNSVKAAYVRGDTVKDTVKVIKMQFDGMITRSAENLARTGTQHYANQARKAMYDANNDVIGSYVYSATLDSRTSVQCAGLDGTVWDNANDVRWPPLHFGCRSSVLALAKGQDKPEGDRPSIGAGDNYEKGDVYKGRKDTKAGRFEVQQVRAATTYETWLKRQPARFQEHILGVKKAKLFRDGLPLDKFTDLTGRELTLDELKRFDIG